MTVKTNCTPHRQWWYLYSNYFWVFLSFLLLKIFFFFFFCCWADKMWNGLGCSRCGLVVGHVSSCCSIVVVVLLGLLSAEAGSAHQRWEEWWNCKRVKESSVHVVSISVCFKINGGPSTEYQLPFRSGNSSQEHPFWFCLTVCLCGNCYTWTCVPWVCRLCTLDKIFFWWPARVTPIFANSLQGRQENMQTKIWFINDTFWRK